jgi:predicted secreted hydrolase
MLAAGIGLPLWPGLTQALTPQTLRFPRDLGSHPDFAIEWWYLTGHLQAGQRQFGFQLTFFRSRVPVTQSMTSAFAAKQLIFAHAAVTDVKDQRLLHSQRIARTSGSDLVDLATASQTDTAVQLGTWSLQRAGSTYQAQASSDNFAFQLSLRETQPILLQGDHGLSRKGPETKQLSCYYSLPQLEVNGQLSVAGQALTVQGQAWLDHEWSQALLHPDAVGWDWIGMNLIDGSALTAFRLRSKTGDTLWAGGSFRSANAINAENFSPNDVVFASQRTWKSPSSGASYPVQWSVQIKHTKHMANYLVKAVIDNQELDSRQSTGAIYWEGLSELWRVDGQLMGHGYLEMTGYASPLIL